MLQKSPKNYQENYQEKYLILLLFLIQFTHIIDFVIMMPLGPKFMTFFGIGPKEFSFVVSSYTLSGFFAGLFALQFLDRFDRKYSLTFLYIGFMIGTLFCGLAPNYYFLLGARIIAGGFGGILGALIFSIVGDVVPENRRGQAMGTVMSAFSVASVIGIPLGLMLSDYFNWHAPFLALFGISILVLVLIGKIMPNLTAHIEEKSKDNSISMKNTWMMMGNLLREKNHQKAFVTTMAIMFSGFLVIPFVSPYMVKNVGLKEHQLSLLYFFGGSCTFMTSRFIGKFSDRWGKFRMFSIVAPLSMIPILIVTHLPSVPVPWAILSSTLFFILVSGRFVPLTALITSSTSKKTRGSFMSLNSSIQMLATGLASLLSGFLITEGSQGRLQGYQYAGYLACIFTILSVYLAQKIEIRD